MMKKDFAEERRAKLLKYINSRNRADVMELAEFAQVTEATIRRDLILMENEKLIYRTHGGALQREQRALWQATTLQERVSLFEDEKDRIGQFAAQLIRDGESIMMDGGSTTLAVARHMYVHQRLLVITNTSTIGELLVGNKNNQVILTGGELIAGTNSVIGPSAETAIRQYRTDKAIIGVSGLLLEEGFFSAIPQEAEIKRLMIQNSRETIVVSDSSKIGTSALCFICDFSSVNKLITDKNISKTARESLEQSGIEVFCV